MEGVKPLQEDLAMVSCITHTLSGILNFGYEHLHWKLGNGTSRHTEYQRLRPKRTGHDGQLGIGKALNQDKQRLVAFQHGSFYWYNMIMSR